MKKTVNEICRFHAAKYPLMRPADAVKLVYQSEFGGGHLIVDSAKSLERLKIELSETPEDRSVPLIEEIGGALVRVNLAAPEIKRITPEKLNEIFVLSAGLVNGKVDSLVKKTGLLSVLTLEGVFGFGKDEFNAYLNEYIAAGCPAVSHSDEYRKAYRPAYRVVLASELPKNLL